MAGPTRRSFLLAAAALALVADPTPASPPDKVYRIGVISAAIRGKPQPTNGHTWHFAQYLHPTIDLDAIKKYLDPGSADYLPQVRPQPEVQLRPAPVPGHEDHALLRRRPEGDRPVHRGVPRREGGEVAGGAGRAGGCRLAGRRVRASARITSTWSPRPCERGLPTFCDKPIGGSVAGTRKILEFAREHKAPIMSSSLFRHEWGMEAALRKRDARRVRPDPVRDRRRAGRVHARRLDGLRPAPGLDGGDAARARRRGGEPVRPRGHLPRPGDLPGPHAGRDLVRPARTRRGSTATRRCSSRRSASSTRRRSRATSGTGTTTRCSAWPRRSARW